MALDLGTSTTRIAISGRGVVCSQASAVSIHEDKLGNRKMLAVGDEALAMLGRTPPEVRVIRPIQDGTIADFEVAEAMLRHLMIQVQGRSLWVGPRVTVTIPYGVVDVERRAIRELVEASGARSVRLVSQSMAAAIGSELPVNEACGHMVVDVGAGKTEVAVISLGGVVYSRALRVGGHHMNQSIIHHFRHNRGILIGPHTAEEVKLTLGAAMPGGSAEWMIIKGRDLTTGFPRALETSKDEIRQALQSSVKLIVGAVVSSLEHTSPELAADVARTGIVMTGAGAQLRYLDRAISDATSLPVVLPERPGDVGVIGAGQHMSVENDSLAIA